MQKTKVCTPKDTPNPSNSANIPPSKTAFVYNHAAFFRQGAVIPGKGVISMRSFVTRHLLVAGLCAAVALVSTPARAQHSADTDASFSINLSELLRVIQFYNVGQFHCEDGTEDGYAPGPGDTTCTPHDSDYSPQNWSLTLSELLRTIQFYNADEYAECEQGEDGYCPVFLPGEGEPEGEGEGSTEGEGEPGFVVVTIPTRQAAPGDTVFLELGLGVQDEAPATLQFDLNYNDFQLNYLGGSGGSSPSEANKVFNAQKLNGGVVRVSITNPLQNNTPMATGALCTLVFKISDSASFGQTFALFGSGASCTRVGGAPASITIANGSITLGSDQPIPPDANFTANPVIGLPGSTVNFTDTSYLGTGTGPLWSWDFGDGGTSTEQNPAHVYANPGTYNVALTVTTSAGANTETKNAFIQIIQGVRVYVNKANNGTEDGLTWQTAFNTLQEGVDAAFAQGGGEVWVAEGTYDEPRGAVTGALVLRDVVKLYGGFNGDEVILGQRSPQANQTIIEGADARNGDPAYHVVTGANNATLDGFTIRGGRANGAGTLGQGAGLYGVAVSMTVANCTFTDNSATTAGGALFTSGGNLTVTSCLFEQNSVAMFGAANVTTVAFGGASYSADANVAFNNCNFIGNTATANGSWTSGANRNVQAFGGALSSFNSTLSLTGCTFTGNIASAQAAGTDGTNGAAPLALGGALHVNSGALTLDRCRISNSRVETLGNALLAGANGAGVYTGSAVVLIKNTAIFSNQGLNPENGRCGSGFACDNTTTQRAVTITNSNIIANASDSSNETLVGGILAINASPVITNTIVWANTNAGIVSQGGTPAVTYSDIQGGFTGTGNFALNPTFVNQNAGNFRLLFNSPCIDSGRDTSSAAFGAVTTDFDGNPRGIDIDPLTSGDGANYDIGIFEYTN